MCLFDIRHQSRAALNLELKKGKPLSSANYRARRLGTEGLYVFNLFKPAANCFVSAFGIGVSAALERHSWAFGISKRLYLLSNAHCRSRAITCVSKFQRERTAIPPGGDFYPFYLLCTKTPPGNQILDINLVCPVLPDRARCRWCSIWGVRSTSRLFSRGAGEWARGTEQCCIGGLSSTNPLRRAVQEYRPHCPTVENTRQNRSQIWKSRRGGWGSDPYGIELREQKTPNHNEAVAASSVAF